MRTAHDNFFLIADAHFNALNRWTDTPGLSRGPRIVHRANASGFGETIDLKNRYAEHQKKLLCLRSERSGAADQRSQILAEAFLNFAEDEFSAEG